MLALAPFPVRQDETQTPFPLIVEKETIIVDNDLETGSILSTITLKQEGNLDPIILKQEGNLDIIIFKQEGNLDAIIFNWRSLHGNKEKQSQL